MENKTYICGDCGCVFEWRNRSMLGQHGKVETYEKIVIFQ